MYIEENQNYIGSIWLEGNDTHLAKLGIFIADPAYRDITLNVRAENVRARKVYTACGFKIKERFKKEKGIETFSMELEL